MERENQFGGESIHLVGQLFSPNPSANLVSIGESLGKGNVTHYIVLLFGDAVLCKTVSLFI